MDFVDGNNAESKRPDFFSGELSRSGGNLEGPLDYPSGAKFPMEEGNKPSGSKMDCPAEY